MNKQTQLLPESESQRHVHPETQADESRIFDLGDSGGSDIAANKDSMIADAFDSMRRRGMRST
jgi:hypothetical protein